MGRHAGAFLVVRTVVEPGFAEEFNRWYNEEHFPARMALPGFLRGHRMMMESPDEGGIGYMAIYELSDESALASPEYLAIGVAEQGSTRTKEVTERLISLDRRVYRNITPGLDAEGSDS